MRKGGRQEPQGGEQADPWWVEEYGETLTPFSFGSTIAPHGLELLIR